MKVAVVGLWHLGTVTAACLARAGHQVIAYDPDEATIAQLQLGKAPIFEPGLESLLQTEAQKGHLHYTCNNEDISEAEIVWLTFDTPVDQHDEADLGFVLRAIEDIFPYLQTDAIVIVSSQVPVGTTQILQSRCHTLYPEKNCVFAYIPENLRLGKALEVFTHPERIVIGLDALQYQSKLTTLLEPFTEQLIWMSVVSAEMTKHAINAFLALSVTFINEMASLCETVGANGRDVELGLKSEARIGPKAYLRPGDAIAGGTLLRDINYLTKLGKHKDRNTFLLSAILESNHDHKQWSCRKLKDFFPDLRGKRIALLGLTYKAGTDTLRRSAAIEICAWLHQQGVIVQAYDPLVTELPEEFAHFIQAKTDAEAALQFADAVLISTECPEFRNIPADEFVLRLKQPLVLDPSGFIHKNIGHDSRIKYFSVGVPSCN